MTPPFPLDTNIPTTDPVMVVPQELRSSEEAKRVFLFRLFIALSVLGAGVIVTQYLLDDAMMPLSLGIAFTIVIGFAVSGAFLARLIRPHVLAFVVSVGVAGLIGVSISATGDASGLAYLLAPILLMTSIFSFRSSAAFFFGCLFEIMVVFYVNGALELTTLANVTAALVIAFTVSSLMANLWNTAFDTQRAAQRENAIFTRRALSAAFPANAVLENGVIYAPTAAFVRLFDGAATDGVEVSAICDAIDLPALKDALSLHIPLDIRKGDRVLEVFSAPIPSRDLPSGNTKSVLAARDVTARARLAEQAATSQRVVALGELAAGVAHEIQNPLTSLVLCVGFLEEGSPAEPDDISEIQRAAERIRRTVNDLIALTNSRGEESVPTLVEDTVASAMRIAEATVRAANGKITVAHRDGDLAMMAAPTRTSQALAHLLVNAVTAQGDPPQRRPEVEVTTSLQDRFVEIRIADNGLGIAPEVAPRIFDPFVTTREVGEGVGLGLSLAHNVMSDSNGTLSVESTNADGTVFLARLPVALNDFDDESSEAVLRPSPALMEAHALVAVDDVAIADAIARILKDTIGKVVVTKVAAAAEAIEEQAFDIVICEVSTRTTDGVHVLKGLNASTMGVALTGGNFSPQVQDFLAEWSGDVLRKPLTHGRLFKVLNRFQAPESE